MLLALSFFFPYRFFFSIGLAADNIIYSYLGFGAYYVIIRIIVTTCYRSCLLAYLFDNLIPCTSLQLQSSVVPDYPIWKVTQHVLADAQSPTSRLFILLFILLPLHHFTTILPPTGAIPHPPSPMADIHSVSPGSTNSLLAFNLSRLGRARGRTYMYSPEPVSAPVSAHRARYPPQKERKKEKEKL